MGQLKIITFTIHESYFALPSKWIKEVVDNDDEVKDLFYGADAIEGILSYEGDLVTVLDSSFFLNIPEEKKPPLIIICKESKESAPMGLTISTIKGIGFVDETKIKMPQSTEAEYISGFIREDSDVNQKVIALLDLEKFLRFASRKIENLTTTTDD